MAEGILRLRRRRDGTLALTGPAGAISDPARRFPSPHYFSYAWLARTPEATVDATTLTLSLANGSATYTITHESDDEKGVWVELAESPSLFDAPPIDQAQADAIAAAREET